MYRYGPNRGNVSPTEVPARLEQLWTARVGSGQCSPLSAANGLVFVCDVDGFQVCALDAASGKTRWRYRAGSRVELPPTLDQGRCLFGARDGWVYCLDANSGQLLWRFRAAPSERRIMVLGRLESPWPVTSGVLVQNGRAYFSAGRVPSTDGGLHVHAVDAATGKSLWVKHPDCTGDLLVSDGAALFMNGTSIAMKDGTLSDPRKPPSYPRGVLGVGPGIADLPPSFDKRVTIEQLIWSHELDKLQQTNGALSDGSGIYGSVLAFTDQDTCAVGLGYQVVGRKAGYALMIAAKGKNSWSMKLSIRVTALVRAGDKLICAGTPLDRSAASKPELWILSAATGKTLQTITLPARPRPDGLIVAHGKVFVATEEGNVLCFGSKE
jgi:outer membrane protein assembly factor BamB